MQLIIIIIKSFYSLWSIGHSWRASKYCDLQLSPWPHSMIFLHFLFHPLLSFCPVLFSLPLLLYPWGFQSNAVFSIATASLRNVCPIQFHFLHFIWISIGFCLVILHSSSFVILSVHFIFIIRLMHLFMNVCNLLVIWSVVTGPFASHLLFSRQKLHCTLYSPQPFFIGCTTWWLPFRGRNM